MSSGYGASPEQLAVVKVAEEEEQMYLQSRMVRQALRLGLALSAAQHAEGHLQVVGVGDWKPTSTRPAWNAEPRLTEDDS